MRILEGLYWSVLGVRIIGLLVLPSVVHDIPLALVAARPTAEVIVFASSGTTAAEFSATVAVAATSRVVLDISFFWLLRAYAGRYVAPRNIGWLERLAARLSRKDGQRLILLMCFIACTFPVIAIAVTARIRLLPFSVAALCGSITWVGLYGLLGQNFSGSVDALATLISTYEWQARLLAFGIVVVGVLTAVIAKRWKRKGFQ